VRDKIRDMPPREELERENLTVLAVLCGKVAGDPSADSATVDKAHALRLEWVRLQQAPHPVLKEQQKIEAQKESLRKRMAEFLSGTR
jgi:hypothetical protein